MKSEAWRHTASEIAKVAQVLASEKVAETREEAIEMAARIVTGASLEAFVDKQ